MRYHDPARPRDSNGWGKIVAPNGATLGPLQALLVEPLPEGDWEVRVHLQRGPATFREYSCRLKTLSSVTGLLFYYECNPEGVLREYFKYDFIMESKAPLAHRHSSAPATTLEDLGL